MIETTSAALPRCPVCDTPDARILEHLHGHSKLELVEYLGRPVLGPPRDPSLEAPVGIGELRTDAGVVVQIRSRRDVEAAFPATGAPKKSGTQPSDPTLIERAKAARLGGRPSHLSTDQLRLLHRRLRDGRHSRRLIAEEVGTSYFAVQYHERGECTCAAKGLV